MTIKSCYSHIRDGTYRDHGATLYAGAAVRPDCLLALHRLPHSSSWLQVRMLRAYIISERSSVDVRLARKTEGHAQVTLPDSQICHVT